MCSGPCSATGVNSPHTSPPRPPRRLDIVIESHFSSDTHVLLEFGLVAGRLPGLPCEGRVVSPTWRMVRSHFRGESSHNGSALPTTLQATMKRPARRKFEPALCAL